MKDIYRQILQVRENSLKANALLYKANDIIENLQSNHSSLQQEENEDVQTSLQKHLEANNEIFDRCRSELHQALCALDNFHDSLNNLQKVQGGN